MNRTLKIGATIVGIVFITALLSFVWTPYDPIHAIAADRLQGPSLKHLLGTDRYGRDVLSALMVGSRITLYVGLISVGIGATLGTPLGVLAAVRGGWLEQVIMRGSCVADGYCHRRDVRGVDGVCDGRDRHCYYPWFRPGGSRRYLAGAQPRLHPCGKTQ